LLPQPYPGLIAPGQPEATKNVLGYLRDQPSEDLPPELPPQSVGPHVEINSGGTIVSAPIDTLDRAGNNLNRLRALHPDLRELACDLPISLCSGNIPHAALAERVQAYATLIEADLEATDFARLYLAGVRLSNAADAARQAIAKNDLPALDTLDQERLDSLLDLHRPFILATAAGTEALDDEARYKGRPAEEQLFKADAVATLQSLEGRSDLIDPEVARASLSAAQEIGSGTHPERSSVAGRSMARNVIIGIASGAVGSALYANAGTILWGVGGTAAFIATLSISETIKRTNWFKSIVESGAMSMNNLTDPAAKEAAEKLRVGLQRHGDFVRENEPALRRLAGDRLEFRFLHRLLDWLKRHVDKQK
jgi:hypothetical protein